ncbi:tagaturonate epimerase family protein [Verrucomicrobia bacterium]|nr:tagaturonate epimerase family protein [Verrucomicrobiota bacterium]MDG1890742.1 tagaturonate epimerase family protein [Verrucomicrobiota bacterium]
MLKIEKYSIGVGDRFAHQAKAQLRACQMLLKEGVEVVPVWNKSNREHAFIGSKPPSVLKAAREAVEALEWKGPWHVDADHIGMKTVDAYLSHSDFFTIDVADFIGREAPAAVVNDFLKSHPELMGSVEVPGIDTPLEISREEVARVATQYLSAIQEATNVYHYIVEKRGDDDLIAEISMDETDAPQRPHELLIILAAMADEGIPAQTIAPKFTGRFNKGVDYVGDLAQFEKEFSDDLAVIVHAVEHYDLPSNLKLSVHSGSDKFSLYPIIHRALQRTGAGVHLKTAGTTWLEEMIGLAEAGGDGLLLAKEIYAYALQHVDALCAPYAAVIDIDPAKLPSCETVNEWSGSQLANALRHIQDHPAFNAHMRQLVHIAFKVAAGTGDRYLKLLKIHEEIVGKNVTENIYERHLKPLFLG